MSSMKRLEKTITVYHDEPMSLSWFNEGKVFVKHDKKTHNHDQQHGNHVRHRGLNNSDDSVNKHVGDDTWRNMMINQCFGWSLQTC